MALIEYATDEITAMVLDFCDGGSAAAGKFRRETP